MDIEGAGVTVDRAEPADLVKGGGGDQVILPLHHDLRGPSLHLKMQRMTQHKLQVQQRLVFVSPGPAGIGADKIIAEMNAEPGTSVILEQRAAKTSGGLQRSRIREFPGSAGGDGQRGACR